MNIINIEHISKLFGDKLIFDDASFGLQEGDKVGIVGINGTGKSTLLRIVAGDETPDSGQIIRQNNLKMAYLPQTPEFPKDATVLSYALSGDEEDWQVQSNLVQLGITEYDAKIDTLSGGQRRKVALAKVLAQDFDLLLLDEPFGALDAFTREQMQTLLLKLWHETGKQVLLITHDIEEAIFMATELVLLSPGPGRVVERLPLDFSRRFVAGESCRSIKSDPRFIEQREYILSRVFDQREAFS